MLVGIERNNKTVFEKFVVDTIALSAHDVSGIFNFLCIFYWLWAESRTLNLK